MSNPASVEDAILQLAMFTQARDARTEDGPTGVTWEIIGLIGQEAYLKDARASVAAMLALGWFPKNDPVPLEMLQSGLFTLDINGDLSDPIITHKEGASS